MEKGLYELLWFSKMFLSGERLIKFLLFMERFYLEEGGKIKEFKGRFVNELIVNIDTVLHWMCITLRVIYLLRENPINHHP